MFRKYDVNYWPISSRGHEVRYTSRARILCLDEHL